MLSEEEKKDLKESACSKELLADFEILRRNSRPADPKNLDLDAYLRFLTDFARAFPRAAGNRMTIEGKFLI
jgi:hypothetical protein